MGNLELDPRAILAALGVSGVTAAEPVSGGWDTAIWRVECAGEAFALRVFHAGEDDTCRREVQVMQAAAAGGISVPSVHAEGSWQDRPAVLLSWCAGRPVRHEMTSDPASIRQLGRAFGQMQARIHALRAPEVLHRDPERSWIDWIGPGEESLKERLHAVAGRADRLLHLDYHPLNVMADGARITGVLDWTNARVGDPRADRARTFAILRVSPLPPGTPVLPALVARWNSVGGAATGRRHRAAVRAAGVPWMRSRRSFTPGPGR